MGKHITIQLCGSIYNAIITAASGSILSAKSQRDSTVSVFTSMDRGLSWRMVRSEVIR